ncbi:MAG TPA: tetratricopeptide repeat protein [Pseudolabrys sp.]|nr:tetratricopeptide repeat protein [Pseudolabrys sp.]
MTEVDVQRKLQAAFSLHQAGNLKEAANIYRKIIETDANNATALHYLGVVEGTVGNLEQAKFLMERSLRIQPSNIQFTENYAAILFQIRDYKSALQICERGLQLNESNVSLLYIGAVSLYKLEQLQSSIDQFDRVLSLEPNHVAAINERGSALAQLNEYDAALASFEKALRLQPQYPEAHLNKGNLYVELKRYDEALAAYDKALTISPSFADAWVGRALVFRKLKRYDEAFAAYDKASVLKPGSAEVWRDRGNAYVELNRHDLAFAAYDKGLSLNPDLPDLEGLRFDAKTHICDWNDFDGERERLVQSVKNKKQNTYPFVLLVVSSSKKIQVECAETWASKRFPAASKPIWDGEIYKHDKIRIAYLSSDFREHATSHLVAGMFEYHDKSRFEISAISTGPDDDSELRERIERSCDKFVEARPLTDGEVAAQIRKEEIDILIDLNGLTHGMRTTIFASRPAPIHVNYLGYPGTMGVTYMDYLIGDKIVIPKYEQAYYREKIVYLPSCYQATDSKRKISEKMLTRAEFGLPAKDFVFCCFNGNNKILPNVFDSWVRILKQVDNSVLWLLEDNAQAAANLKREATTRGIDGDRLVFAPRVPSPEHLARHRLADLFIDTLPYNAHTTASDALWAGLPVLTQLGETFAGRVAASLLNAVGLPELITTTTKAYEDLAIDLATNSDKLAAIKRKLANNRFTSPLFDTELFTRHIETAYLLMYERYQKNLDPDHISVPQ